MRRLAVTAASLAVLTGSAACTNRSSGTPSDTGSPTITDTPATSTTPGPTEPGEIPLPTPGPSRSYGAPPPEVTQPVITVPPDRTGGPFFPIPTIPVD